MLFTQKYRKDVMEKRLRDDPNRVIQAKLTPDRFTNDEVES